MGLLDNIYNDLHSISPEKAEQFKAVGLPHRKMESWRYTPVALLESAGLRLNGTKTSVSHENTPFEAHIIRIENGKIRSADSTAGLTVTEVETSFHNHENGFEALFSSEVDTQIRINISRAFKSELPILVIHHHDEKHGMKHHALHIHLEKGSSATVVEKYEAAALPAFLHVKSQAFVEQDAHLSHVLMQNHTDCPSLLCNTYAEQEGKSTYHNAVFTYAGDWVRNELSVLHLGEYTNTMMTGLYLADGNRLVDNHTNLEHSLPNCESNEFYKGIAKDKGQAIFNGRIHVHQDAQKTNAYQNNANLLLSSEAQINAKPQLEIFADDVKCSHGATVGKLSQQEVYYLRSRGISKQEAENMLTMAFGVEPMERIENEAVRDYLIDHFTQYFGMISE